MHHYAAALNSIPIFDHALRTPSDPWLWRMAQCAGGGLLALPCSATAFSLERHHSSWLISYSPALTTSSFSLMNKSPSLFHLPVTHQGVVIIPSARATGEVKYLGGQVLRWSST